MAAFRSPYCYAACMRFVTTLTALLAGLALAVPAAADKGGGHQGDTSPGNSGDHKTVICHHAGPTKTITITVDNQGQLNGHLNHGDSIGPCPVTVTPPPPTTTPTPEPTCPDGITCDGPPAPVVPGPPLPPLPSQPEPTPPAPAPPYTVAPAPKPQQLKLPARLRGHKIKQVVVPWRKKQKALEQRVEQARAQQRELPHTGFPALLLLGAGIAGIAGGTVLRRKS